MNIRMLRRRFDFGEFNSLFRSLLQGCPDLEVNYHSYPGLLGLVHITIAPTDQTQSDFLWALVEPVNALIGRYNVREPQPGERMQKFCTFGRSVTLLGHPEMFEIIINYPVVPRCPALRNYEIRERLRALNRVARERRRLADLQKVS